MISPIGSTQSGKVESNQTTSQPKQTAAPQEPRHTAVPPDTVTLKSTTAPAPDSDGDSQ
ncbi:MAG: hypothetical protein WCB53_21250 [Terriglobales bacterium]